MAVGKKWSVYERRSEIMRILDGRRRETMSNFAFQFGVSIRTICYDIDALTASHPIETVRGKNGCVKLTDGYRAYQNIFSEEAQNALSEIIPLVNERLAATIQGLLVAYGPKPKRETH
jgi:predicted DNA-binding transcriptional regulator YafY